MGIERAIKEFLSFLRYPTFDYKREDPLSFGMVTGLFFLVFLVEMLLFAPMSSLLGLEDMPHAMQGVLESYASWKVFVLAVILAPIAEEFIFRLHLRYKILNFIFFMILLVIVVGLISGAFSALQEAVMYQSKEDMTNIFIHSDSAKRLIPMMFMIVLMPLLAITYLISNKFKQWANNFSGKDFAIIFYLTAGLFAFVHAYNFELDPSRWYLVPLLVFPQLFLALYLGYVRVRNNIFYSIYIHALNNSIPMAILFLAGGQ